MVDSAVAGGVAAGHTRDTAAQGKSMKVRVSRVAGDVRAHGGSVLGDHVGATGDGAKSLTSRTAQKWKLEHQLTLVSLFLPSSSTYCIWPHPSLV